MISALARYESAVSSAFCVQRYSARSAYACRFSKLIWPQCPPRISMIFRIDFFSLTMISCWCSWSFKKAEPAQLRTNLVASSVYLPSGHVSNSKRTFWEYTWRSSFGRIKRWDKRGDLIGHHLRTCGGWWSETFAFRHLRQMLMSKLPWISALTAASSATNVRGLTKVAETQISTWRELSALSPKRKHLTRFRWRRQPGQMNHQGRPAQHQAPWASEGNQMAQTLSLPSSLPVGPEPQCYWNIILDGRDLDAFTWFHVCRQMEGFWKEITMESSCNNRAIHSVCVYVYLYIERERDAAIDIGHVGDRISRTVESSSRGWREGCSSSKAFKQIGDSIACKVCSTKKYQPWQNKPRTRNYNAPSRVTTLKPTRNHSRLWQTTMIAKMQAISLAGSIPNRVTNKTSRTSKPYRLSSLASTSLESCVLCFWDGSLTGCLG